MRHGGRLETFMVLLWIVVSLVAGPAVAAPAPADSAGASPRLKYLPKDYWLVAECDCGTVMKFMNSAAARQNPQYAQFQQYLRLLKKFTAIDLEKDVDWITLFVTNIDEPKVLAVAQGSFKNDDVAERLGSSLKNVITETTYKGHTIYSLPNAGLCFPEESTLLVGDETLVQQALDQLAARKRQLPRALKSVLDRTPGKSVVWAAVEPRVLLDHKLLADWREGHAELHRTLKKMDCLSLFFDLSNDGLLIQSLGYVSAPGEAKNLHRYLSDRKKDLLHKEGSNVLFTSLLILSEIKTSGPYVEGSFRITGEAFKELWETKVIIRPETPARDSKDQ